MSSSNQQLWLAWALVSGGFLLLLGMGLFMTSAAAANPQLAKVRSWFLPGKTSHGHYQIELACEACHVKPLSALATTSSRAAVAAEARPSSRSDLPSLWRAVT